MSIIGSGANQLVVNGLLGSAAYFDVKDLPASSATQGAIDAAIAGLATVARTGSYSDLTDKVPTATEQELAEGTQTGARLFSPKQLGDSFASNLDYQEFTSSGTWTKPEGTSLVFVQIIGGGGGGGAGQYGAGSSGGRAGACVHFFPVFDSSYDIVVGIGGSQGYRGGTSSAFGLVCTGGGGGGPANSSPIGPSGTSNLLTGFMNFVPETINESGFVLTEPVYGRGGIRGTKGAQGVVRVWAFKVK